MENQDLTTKLLLRIGTSLLMIKIDSMLPLKFWHPMERPGRRIQIFVPHEK
jgi:hypothetical protein